MLRTGKIPESVLKRSVLRQIKTKREEVLLGAGIGGDCAAIDGGDCIYVMSTDPITNSKENAGSLAIIAATNDIAASGARAMAVMLSMIYPQGTEEESIKAVMKDVERTCAKLNVQAIGGHTEVSTAVNRPIITATGIGRTDKGRLITAAGAKSGDDIVVTKWIGIEGAYLLANENGDKLSEALTDSFIDKVRKTENYLSVIPEADIAVNMDVSAMHDMSEGGVFAALWEMAEASGKGFTVDIKAIPVRQEVIEVCEVFGLNPYELDSGGSMLIASSKGHDLVRELKAAGIDAAVIGKFTGGNDRIVQNDEEKRYAEPPKADEILLTQTSF